MPPADLAALPGWAEDQVAAGIATFVRSCGRPPPGWAETCAAARRVPPGDEGAARRFALDRFQPPPARPASVTGYYEAELPGSRVPTPEFPVPVLRPPRAPRQFSRAEVLDGALAGQGLELLYLRSVGDLWLIQLQGAGRIRLPDGTLVRLGHAGDNGRPTQAPGQVFAGIDVPRNELSGPMIRSWMAARPREAEARIRRDPNYVFFREQPDLPPDVGTRGLSGATLTPLRSVAVDPRSIPLGTPLWLEVETPGGTLRRLVVAQDTGELIQGPRAIDLYFGWGNRAENAGGRMAAEGRLWVLHPRAPGGVAPVRTPNP